MIRFDYQESIAASPEAVFAVMSDFARFDEWLGMDGRPIDDGQVRTGSRFESTGRLGPFTVHGTGEVTRCEPGRAFGFRMAAPGRFDFVLDLRLEPMPEGTRLDGSGSMTTHRLWRLLEPMLRAEVPKGEVREAQRLKALLEAGS